VAVAEAEREEQRHALADNAADSGTNLEGGDDDAGGNGQRAADHGAEENIQGETRQADEDVLRVGIHPGPHLGVLHHGHLADVARPGEVGEEAVHLLVRGEHAGVEVSGTAGKDAGGEEEGDEEGVDEPVPLEEFGELFVAAHPEHVAPVHPDPEGTT